MNKLPITCADDALKYGGIFARSGLFGDSVNSDDKGAVIAIMCHGENMGLLEFQKTYHVVENKPSMKADVMLAKLLDFGGDYEILERSETRAAVKMKRFGGDWYEFSLTFDEIKAAGYCYKHGTQTLTRSYRIRPKNMIWARLVSDSVRVIDPRVNAGIYTKEEFEDESTSGGSEHKNESPAKDYSKGHFEGGEKTETNIPSEPAAMPGSTEQNSGVDFNLVPFGKFEGKRWIDLPRDTLAAVIQTPPDGVSKQHLQAAKVAFDKMPF